MRAPKRRFRLRRPDADHDIVVEVRADSLVAAREVARLYFKRAWPEWYTNEDDVALDEEVGV